MATIPIGDRFPVACNSIIEIPKGTKNKYEYDETLGAIKLDRVVHSSVVYPVNYGFIPETRAEDGDHLDVLVLSSEQIFPGCVVEIRPIGVLKMTDDKGEDWKIIGVILADPHSDTKQDVSDIDDAQKAELEHFFSVYKQLENKQVTIHGWGNRQEAYTAIQSSHETFLRGSNNG